MYDNLGAEFKCFDGSRTLTIDKVNDDYCDCRDGSDEPGTSACPTQQFYCKNEFAQPKLIFSSRVIDGFCDCCDGSDEFDVSRGRKVKDCPNTCKEEGRAYSHALLQEIKEVEEGLNIARLAAPSSGDFKLAKLREKVVLTAEIAALEIELAEAEQKSTAVIQSRDQYKEKKTAELKVQFGVVDEAPKNEAPTEEKKDADDEWAEDDSAPSEEVQPNAEAAPAEQASTEQPPPPPPPPAVETPQQKLDSALTQDGTLQTLDNDVNNANNAASDVRNRKTNKENDLTNVNKILDLDFGPNSRFSPLYNVQFQGNFGEYTYYMNPFVDAKQSTTSLGTFSSWKTPYSVMAFTAGVHCWGGPDRSVEVSLICGKENKIVEVREPSKCTYTMGATTPFACSEELLKSLRDKLPRGS
jgi:protein kinase C substrate 80K-H